MTPTIPSWIRDYRCPNGRFRNIYEYMPDETRLYGTESLFGDWDGEVLLLAQDFCCTEDVERWIEEGHERVYAHNPSMITNKSLELYTSGFDCGILYGSALGGMLKVGKSNSGLSGWSQMSQHLCRVLHFTISNMPNLYAIVCLGSVAWDLSHKAFGAQCNQLTNALRYHCPSNLNGIRVYAMPHPSRASAVMGSKQQLQDRWAWLHRELIGTSGMHDAA